MVIHDTLLVGVKIIEPVVFADGRGYFFENYSYARYSEAGIADVFVQDNHSCSRVKGTLRGLHFQLSPKAQVKLIRCTGGAMLDVVVDIRLGSPTFGKWESFELSADNFKQIYIPKGYAHGFLALTDDVEVQYKASEYYAPEYDRSIRWDDPQIGIAWGVGNPILSEKDRTAPLLSGSDNNFRWGHGV